MEKEIVGTEQVIVSRRKVQGIQRNKYQVKTNRRAYTFGQQTQNSIHRTQRRPNKSPPSSKKTLCRKNNSSNPISWSIKAFPEFLEFLKILTRDQDISSVVEGYRIPFPANPHQKKIPGNICMSLVQENPVDTKISEMLTKEAISVLIHQCCHPVINLKELNKHIPYQHFKMEGLHYLKFMLQQKHYMCELDLKDSYFSVPLSKKSRKMIRF